MSRPEIAALRKKLTTLSASAQMDANPLQPPPAGSLVEWVGREGSGASSLGLKVVRDVLSSRAGLWAIVDPDEEFLPSAAWGWGIPLGRMVVIRPHRPDDVTWAVEHCLRSPAIAVTWSRIDSRADRCLRRWKRAAEIGGGVGVLFRTERTGSGTGVDQRWHCEAGQQNPFGRTIEVALEYCRGSFQGGNFQVEVHDAEGALTLVPPVARPAAAGRSAGGA